MSRADIKILTPLSPIYSRSWLVASGAAASIKAGEPVKGVDAAAASPWLGTVALMADGDGTTTQRFTGLAKATSTDTVAAAGEVTLWLPLPHIIYSGKAKTSSTADTAAEILALQGKRVVFDVTSSVFTVEAEAADAVANCVTIIGGDPNTKELEFVYHMKGSALGFVISA